MSVYHFNYRSFETEVCSDVNDCYWELHVLDSDVKSIDEANDLFQDYLWYEHNLAMEASYEIVKNGIDPDSPVADALIDVYVPVDFENFMEFKRVEKRYNELKKNFNLG